jgi:hypothetical protein
MFAVVAVLTITLKSACTSHCTAVASVSLTLFESTGEVNVFIQATVWFQVSFTTALSLAFKSKALCVAVDIGKSAIAISCGVPFQLNLPFTVLEFI